MIENADPIVEDGRLYGQEDRIVLGNLYLKEDPTDPDDEGVCLGHTWTAFLYDPDDEPQEILTGPTGAVPFEMTRRQGIALRDRLNQLIK
jgi:hypothetical protein